MKRNVSIALAVAVVIAMPIAYWLVSPLFITKQVNESVADIPTEQPSATEPTFAEPSATREGTFVGQLGHHGEGTVTIREAGGKTFVRFEDDFKVTNGPDLFVYFGKDGAYAAEAKLAALKGNVGGQNYEVPAGIDAGAYDEVWVWCRSFSVPFARAVLK